MDILIGKALLISIADFFLISASIIAGYILLVKPLSFPFFFYVVIIALLLAVSALSRVASEIITRKNI